MVEITLRQLKAARALLDWSQVTLSEAAGIPLNAVYHIERHYLDRPILGTHEVTAKLIAALETAGIVFVPADPPLSEGVRLRSHADGAKGPTKISRKSVVKGKPRRPRE